MIAKAKAIAHGQQAINYALREGKMGKFLASNLISCEKPDEILQEFEMMQRYNDRCKNKFLRFEIGIAPQDEAKLKHADLQTICRQFAKSMGLTDNQWFACTHKDTDNLHIHLIANRINLDGAVYQTDFISNHAAKTAEELSRKMGLTIANEVRKQKQHEKQQMSPERFEVKKRLQDIAYMELRNTNNKTPKQFIDALKRQGVSVEPVRNKQNKIYGIRFQFEGQTFKASEIGKEFGLRSIFMHYGELVSDTKSQPQHFEQKPIIPQNQSSALETATGIIGGLLDLTAPTSDFDPEEAALKRQTQAKKKKKRRLGW
jgi:hypothetical protein